MRCAGRNKAFALSPVGLGVPPVAEGLAAALDAVHDLGARRAGVVGDLLGDDGHGVEHDPGAGLLELDLALDVLVALPLEVGVSGPHFGLYRIGDVLLRLGGKGGRLHGQVGDAAAGHEACLHGSADSVNGVLVAQALLLELRLRGGANADACDAPRKRGDALAELLLVEGGGGFLLLLQQPLDAALNGFVELRQGQNGGAVLPDDHVPGHAQHVNAQVVEADAHVLGDEGRPGGGGDVLEVVLAALAEGGGLDGHDLQHAAHLVDYEGLHGLGAEVLCDDDQRRLRLGRVLQDGQDRLRALDLAVRYEDLRRAPLDGVLLLAQQEVGVCEAAVEGVALGEVQLVLQSRVLLEHGGGVRAKLVEGLGNDLAHHDVTAGGDGCNIQQVVVSIDGFAQTLELFDNQFGRLLDAFLDGDGIVALVYVLHALFGDLCCQDGRGCGTVTRADVAAAGAEGHPHGVRHGAHSGQQAVAALIGEYDFLRLGAECVGGASGVSGRIAAKVAACVSDEGWYLRCRRRGGNGCIAKRADSVAYGNRASLASECQTADRAEGADEERQHGAQRRHHSVREYSNAGSR
ncbi:DNA polymerase II large subunit [Babesia caballi]|uniref:DNA polymerase II large subunit n=1 Tax=Babesia caballi TaxID=5871 RepID=A0AAV4M0M8_BABCB|nr:DNA polymerase II large subunit [Babesia caballi]